jgi:hypothetical protein
MDMDEDGVFCSERFSTSKEEGDLGSNAIARMSEADSLMVFFQNGKEGWMEDGGFQCYGRGEKVDGSTALS